LVGLGVGVGAGVGAGVTFGVGVSRRGGPPDGDGVAEALGDGDGLIPQKGPLKRPAEYPPAPAEDAYMGCTRKTAQDCDSATMRAA